MANSTSYASFVANLVVISYSFWLLLMPCNAAVPAVYVFGDSLADVGNNNYLDFSLLKADFPYNGIDYPGSIATGRFSNGKNSADILADKLGLPTSLPYLAMSSGPNNTQAYLNGVSFASAGAGVLDVTNSGKCLSMNQQIDYYSTVYGELVEQLGSAQALNHLSQSIFAIIIGSNDIFDYNTSSSENNPNDLPQEFVDSMITTLTDQLKRIYNLGARKFMVVGTGPIGCCPAQRNLNSTEDCRAPANSMSSLYSTQEASMLLQLKLELGDMNYSFFDTYSALIQLIQNPSFYGFTEVKAACCGMGNLRGEVGCLPIASFCPNRTNHIFWDLYHPTQATDEILTGIAFDGSAPYVYPINVQKLSIL